MQPAARDVTVIVTSHTAVLMSPRLTAHRTIRFVDAEVGRTCLMFVLYLNLITELRYMTSRTDVDTADTVCPQSIAGSQTAGLQLTT